jgi:predicted NodU family carbamoyl transferase
MYVTPITDNQSSNRVSFAINIYRYLSCNQLSFDKHPFVQYKFALINKSQILECDTIVYIQKMMIRKASFTAFWIWLDVLLCHVGTAYVIRILTPTFRSTFHSKFQHSTKATQYQQSRRFSTPFENDLYNSNPYQESGKSSLSVPSDTKLIIGLNKYSHDASICAADATTGKVLFALSKERLTRKKHDSGNTASLLDSCLQSLNLHGNNVQKVIMNNHHHRILPLESNVRQMEWESALNINGGNEIGYDEPENIYPNTPKYELSHHLAHAYSTATQSPFTTGLCIVMDGMGETYRTMQRAIKINDPTYISDLSFGITTFQCQPPDIVQQAATSYYDWREAESVYIFSKSPTTIDIRPVFKRFTCENTPPTLYNHGFENMDSIGAVYSRVSTHIFGDWNACGKVMGLAPWAKYKWNDRRTITAKLHSSPILDGSLFTKDFRIDRTLIEGIPHIARSDPDLYDDEGEQRKRYDFDDDDGSDYPASADDGTATTTAVKRLPTAVALDAIALAHRVQTDLENVVIDFVRICKETTGATNLCIAGGVALNSVLNGRLSRELGFEQTFISPYPGDDGIAIGCCAFGLFGNPRLEYTLNQSPVPLWQRPISPYLGPEATDKEMTNAIDEALPWLDVEVIRDDSQRIAILVDAIEQGAVVAWYRSRSEMGPRALGHRSILADPRKKGLVRFINENVKGRESFRPFAPSVLAEEAVNWFDLGSIVPSDGNVSPYMSLTAFVHEDKRSLIPAVTHVDGSSRLQTVTQESDPLYHQFIDQFFQRTGIPMVLNTSFNTMPSEPIVESPKDAIRSFLYSMGAIEFLVLGDYVIRRKQPDLRRLLGEANAEGRIQIEPGFPRRAGAVSFESTFDLEQGPTEDGEVLTRTRVRMSNRPIYGKDNEWFELLDELEGEILSVCDGTVSFNEILSQYTVSEDNSAQEVEANENMLQNIIHRLIRLYEHTLISW